ncbi:universal stress protein [Natronorubrum daqingense]|uniref:Nucleotide-binding universal stress protein, UspA family n=1 Tax=Natronorubrum daqingense TaxID=588898 RepID=A0A1N7EVG5_9EURY|nr:universal stress protein [Natronorubrum daqingense]APX97691.1 universal stress protein UspA [Natronorubrum daqingense]SIR92056.1 Nucleotide-binding universal stress protein, UspA family [Natronorubrum daqingense]
MTRHLLVPMDDSEPARGALEHALTVFPDDEITVVHAIDDLESAYGGGSPVDADTDAGTPEPDFFADVRTIGEEHGHEVTTAVVEGTSATAILEYGREHGVDQIIMGSEGRSGVSRVLLGSVAEAVTRQSEIPVTIVP